MALSEKQKRLEIARKSSRNSVAPKMNNQMHERIREYRKQRGLTMKALAEQIGTSQQQIDRLEKGQRRLTIEWLEKLSDALECELTDFLPLEHQQRNVACTSKAKIVGVCGENGVIEWLPQNESYSIVFGRPKGFGGGRLFGVRVEAQNMVTASIGAELVFTEIDSIPVEDTVRLLKSAVVVIHELKNHSYCLGTSGKTPEGARIRAILVKQIQDVLL